jgi:hypothetical protein
VYRAWQEKISALGPKSLPSYSVARELEKLPDRFKIIEAKPDITKMEAVAIRHEREGKAPRSEVSKPQADSPEDHQKRWWSGLLIQINKMEGETRLKNGGVDRELAAVWAKAGVDQKGLDRVEAFGKHLIEFVVAAKKGLQQLKQPPDVARPKKEQPLKVAKAA